MGTNIIDRRAIGGKVLSVEVPKGKPYQDVLREFGTDVKIAYLNDQGKRREFRRHKNPEEKEIIGGWVEKGLTGKEPYVGERVRLGKDVIIADEAVVTDDVLLVGSITVENFAKVWGTTFLSGTLTVKDWAEIGTNEFLFKLYGTGEIIEGNTRLPISNLRK